MNEKQQTDGKHKKPVAEYWNADAVRIRRVITPCHSNEEMSQYHDGGREERDDNKCNQGLRLGWGTERFHS